MPEHSNDIGEIMNVKIVSKRPNMILSRTEYIVIITFEGATPSIKDIRNTLITSLGIPGDRLIIKTVEQKYGSKELKINCYSYEKLDVLKQIEPAYVLRRNGLLNSEPSR